MSHQVLERNLAKNEKIRESCWCPLVWQTFWQKILISRIWDVFKQSSHSKLDGTHWFYFRKRLLDELHKKQRELLVCQIDADLAYVKRVKSEKELTFLYREAIEKFNKAKELGNLSQELIDVSTEFFENAREKFPFLKEEDDEEN